MITSAGGGAGVPGLGAQEKDAGNGCEAGLASGNEKKQLQAARQSGSPGRVGPGPKRQGSVERNIQHVLTGPGEKRRAETGEV